MRAFLAIDWGSTNVRLYHLDSDGNLISKRHYQYGITNLEERSFESVYKEMTEGISYLPALMCGMVGSKKGWREAPYVSTPLSIEKLASQCIPISTDEQNEIYIVPGLISTGAFTDVMRGEETLLLGVEHDGWVCLPGTHSKWAFLKEGSVQTFKTFMTGELYSLLSKQGLIGELFVPGDFNVQAFLEGVVQSASNGALLNNLFSVRSRVVCGDMNANCVQDYLSGILIGSEIAGVPNISDVYLVGEDSLMDRYSLAVSVLHPKANVEVVSSEELLQKAMIQIWEQINAEVL